MARVYLSNHANHEGEVVKSGSACHSPIYVEYVGDVGGDCHFPNFVEYIGGACHSSNFVDNNWDEVGTLPTH
ncbi:hypothetical protein SAMN05216225_101339 [Ornithinibacillus halophilus]|uniref:Uncharacterized protein n=1 Tax=Ornithinibacillus halophilus TaxID=930117 RepID=A0A1M5GJI0_9BACI|nr:hypothetical protein SAMN05216225_101339 [Ornithinibacillus halophilus]